MNPITKIIGTTFPLNAHWNTICGNNVFKTEADWKQFAYSQSGIIAEEIKELGVAVKAIEDATGHEGMSDRIVAARDAIADAIVTIDGALHRLDLSLNLFAEDEHLRADFATFGSVWHTGETPKEVLDALNTIATLESSTEDLDAAVNAVRVLYSYVFTVAETYGAPVLRDVMNVYVSNMSKYTTQRKVAESGAKHLVGFDSKINKVAVNGKEYYSVCSAKEQTIGQKTYPLNKVLKPHFYVEPFLLPHMLWQPFSLQVASAVPKKNIGANAYHNITDWKFSDQTYPQMSNEFATYVFDVIEDHIGSDERIKRVDDLLEVAGGIKPHGSVCMLSVRRLGEGHEWPYLVSVLKDGQVRCVTLRIKGDSEIADENAVSVDLLAQAILTDYDAVCTKASRHILFDTSLWEIREEADCGPDVVGDIVGVIEED